MHIIHLIHFTLIIVLPSSSLSFLENSIVIRNKFTKYYLINLLLFPLSDLFLTFLASLPFKHAFCHQAGEQKQVRI
jgi:hypothetical protein